MNRSNKFLLAAMLQLFIFGTPALSQSPSYAAQLDSVVSWLAKGNLEGPQLGMMGHRTYPSEQYKRFRFLKFIADTADLVRLTDHASPVVRCYAFDALAERGKPVFLDLAERHADDSARVTHKAFDMESPTTVGQYISNESFARFVRHWEPTATYHDRIKKLCADRALPPAIVALARLHDPEDQDLILDYLSNKRTQALALEAISHYPAEKFFDKLAGLYEQQINSGLPILAVCVPMYESLLAYPREETLALLKKTVSMEEGFAGSIHRIALYRALHRNTDSYYSSLRDSLKLSAMESHLVEMMGNEEE